MLKQQENNTNDLYISRQFGVSQASCTGDDGRNRVSHVAIYLQDVSTCTNGTEICSTDLNEKYKFNAP
jgi:hypothetical protein